eukprot:CAMPEP_0115045208 /NCGR_PEP_ID=MMETSP0216-20121206/47988_1 /TAXON_ID=223996 /ORGANISM="Protocruzia adherens, Strain Boccale" /LENGTH=324 /DNA_ID=CAMNT_0002427997 /DNA_START=217 /DNA_END=1191 /DNA_ORIENTATION=-
MNAYRWLMTHGVSDETCSPYQARGWDNGLECQKGSVCFGCDSDGYCGIPRSYKIWSIKDHGVISGEMDMINEIHTRGSIACGIYSKSEDFAKYRQGVFTPSEERDKTASQYVTIVGWGYENSLPYWLLKNSFGDSWGFNSGYMKLARGIDALGVESNQCAWAIPNPEPTVITNNDYPIPILERFLSSTINQNSPHLCNGSWAVASVNTLASRFNILRHNQWPRVLLNAQVLLNIQAGGGSCQGGNPTGVYQIMSQRGLTNASCSQWISADLKAPAIDAINFCQTCSGDHPPTAMEDGQQNCLAVNPSQIYYVSESGRVYGIDLL